MEMRRWVRKQLWGTGSSTALLKGSVLVVELSGKRAHTPAGRC